MVDGVGHSEPGAGWRGRWADGATALDTGRTSGERSGKNEFLSSIPIKGFEYFESNKAENSVAVTVTIEVSISI